MVEAPRFLRYADGLYQRLLSLFPMQYHREGLSDEMAQVFRDMCREVYQKRGLLGLLHLWFSVLFDTVWVALNEQLQIRGTFSAERRQQFGGWSAVVGGGSMMMMAFTHGSPNWIFWARQHSLDILYFWIAVSYLSIWVGLMAHQQKRILLGTLGCLTGVSGGAIMLGSGLWMLFRNYLFGAPVWWYYDLGWIVASAGLIVFGLSALGSRTPATNILISMTSGVAMLGFHFLLPAHHMGILFPYDSTLFGIVTGLCWVALGRILLADSPNIQRT